MLATTTLLSTSGGPVTLLTVPAITGSTPLPYMLSIWNGTAADGYWSMDGGTTYAYLPPGPSLLNISNPAENNAPLTVGTTIQVKPNSHASTVTNKALTSNVATLTTAAAHNFSVGDFIVVAGVDATFNGTYVVTVVGSTTTLSYALTHGDVSSTPATGTITGGTDLTKLAAWLR